MPPSQLVKQLAPSKPLVSSPLSIPPGSAPPTDAQAQALEKGPEQSLEDDGETSLSLPMRIIRPVLGWMTPYEQMEYLRRKKDTKRWELFRDALMRRWSNLNVICGLIMGAISTIVFANFPLSRASFTLGIVSLLSSLIAIGFGVGLIYVLGDVRGSSLINVDNRYPRLHLFALSIPEVWAFISFGTFFADVSVIVWQAPNKGWIVKAGVTLAAVALVGHLVAFGFLFREQDTTEFLIPDEEVFVTASPKAFDDGAQSQPQYQSSSSQLQGKGRRDTQATAVGNGSSSPSFGKNLRNVSGSGDGRQRHNANSKSSQNTNSRSSRTLIASPGMSSLPAAPAPSSSSSSAPGHRPPMGARTVPDPGSSSDYNGMHGLAEESEGSFVPRPAGDVRGMPASVNTE